MKILIIVESPAKAQTIQKILGKDEYIVKSSFGHIRNLCCKSHNNLGVDVDNNYKPKYVKIKTRNKQIDELQTLSKECSRIILAADEDREGEAIAWHLCQVLKLDVKITDRIVFHEITKTAIKKALEEPRRVDMNMVKAQQARQIVDKLVGFEISPILCSNIRSSLSAGRVQSVCMKMIIEREDNIEKFQSSIKYKTNALMTNSKISDTKINCSLNKSFEKEEETTEFLKDCINAKFTIRSIVKETKTKKPPPPFTTSSLQQEVGKRFGIPSKKIMSIAQHLYESGFITYHRTDSLNLSAQIMTEIKGFILDNYSNKYHKARKYKASAKGAQEAHEAIRPTKISRNVIVSSDECEKKVYEMIWRRTVATQMSDMIYDEWNMYINISNRDEEFSSKENEITFDGYRKVYKYDAPSANDGDNTENQTNNQAQRLVAFKKLKSEQCGHKGDELQYNKITSTETHSKAQGRYTEPTLIKKMETYGIGRPSTYASTMATIQDRGYVVKKSTKGKEINCKTFTLENGSVVESTRKTKLEVEKNKLFPTETGTIVSQYLTEHFTDIMEYDYTANFEKELDKIYKGDIEWTQTVDKYYKSFHPKVAELRKSSNKPEKTKKYIGIDKASGEKMYVYIAKFGPVIQIGENDNIKYIGLDNDVNIETLTEEEANKYTSFPKNLGKHNGEDVIIKKGRYGYYISHNGNNYKFNSETNENTDLKGAINCIEGSTQLLKKISKTISIKKGKFGPFIQIGKKFASLPAKYNNPDEIDKLTEEVCKEIISAKK